MNMSKNQFKCSEIKSEVTFKNKVYPVREITVYDGPENGNGLYRVSTYVLQCFDITSLTVYFLRSLSNIVSSFEMSRTLFLWVASTDRDL